MDVNQSKDKPREALAPEQTDRTEEPTVVRERSRAVALGYGLLYGLWGYLAHGSPLPFGAAPFGIALLCASDRRVLYLYGGLLLAALRGGLPVEPVVAYTAILPARLLARWVLERPRRKETVPPHTSRPWRQVWPTLFTEPCALRMATAAVAAFGVGLSRLIRGGFLFYDLYGAILATLSAPLAVLLLCGYWGRAKRDSYRWLIGLCSIAFVLIRGVGGQSLLGISLGAVGCMLLVLYVTRTRGLVPGTLTGTLCGLAVSVQYTPAFAFGALSAGLLLPVSVTFGAVSGAVVSLAWGIYVSGMGVLNGFLPAMVVASVLFAVADKLFRFGERRTSVPVETEQPISESKSESESVERVEPADRSLPLLIPPDGMRLAQTDQRLHGLCESLSSLSEVLYGLSRQMQTPTEEDLRRICDNAFDGACASCPDQRVCWSTRYRETTAEVGQIGAALGRSGRVTPEDVGEALQGRCSRLPDILEEINHNAALHRREAHEGDRTEVFAMDYMAIATLLGHSLGAEETVELLDGPSEALCRRLWELDAELTGACVTGGRRRRVAVRGRDGEALLRHEPLIREAVEQACSFSVCEGALAPYDGCLLCFEERERLRLRCAKRTSCAEGEATYCGDTAGTFYGADGRFFAFISDGMGSGREAALTSGISGLFLRKLLGVGCDCETTLGMLNGFLRTRGGGSRHECSATVDLMELDPVRSSASFYKSGAAPTYVFRSGSLFKLRSHTVPVGIIREPDIRRIGFEISGGDVIVMVSDGVTQGREECPWLFDLLRSQGESAAAERLAELVVKYAKDEGSPDDISVLVIKAEDAASA